VHDDDDLQFLGGVSYFRGLPVEELIQIRACCHQRALEVGEFILLEGQPAEALYIVCRGSVRVFKTAATGRKEQVLIVLRPGETFNDVPVFDGGSNPASARAAEADTRVCVLPVSHMTRLLATNPRIRANVIRVLAGRLRHLTLLVEDLSFHHSTRRVARLLLEEGLRTGGVVTLSQQEMAARVGTAREVVSRALRELEQRGALTRGPRQRLRVETQALGALLNQDTDPRI